jgi:uncharacterized protein YkwD
MSCIPFLAALGISLAGCSDSSLFSGEPSFYKHLAAYNVKVDATAARDMISIYRRNNGLATLSLDPDLQKAAEAQVKAMAERDQLSHSVDGSLMSRVDRTGIKNTTAVENISAGYHTLAEAFSGWRQSPPHNANMLNPAMRRMGIATAYAPQSKYKVFWALILSD